MERKLNKGIETATCDKSDLEVRIRRLLEGVYIEEKKPQKNDFFERPTFNVAGDLHLSNVSGNENIVVQGVKDSNINIGEFVNALATSINNSQKNELEELADKLVSKIEANQKLKESEKVELETVKKGKWETKLKFAIPFTGLEFSRTIPPEEFIDKVQRWLYGDGLQTNLLNSD
ncbi:MAG TPA: hypothetical protein PKY59_24820 [Pyrinomonadaceae bacterium]|nr:hypothetical protein [Pyrinomonadaceae bacterium]